MAEFITWDVRARDRAEASDEAVFWPCRAIVELATAAAFEGEG